MVNKLFVLFLGALALGSAVIARGQSSPWSHFQGNVANTGQGVGPRASGVLAWTNTTLGPAGFYGGSVIGPNGLIYESGENSGVFGLNPDGSVKWSTTVSGQFFLAEPALDSSGNLYAAATSGTIIKFSPSLGISWSYSTGDPLYGGLSVGTDGTIYACGFNGGIYALNSTGHLLWSYQTGSHCGGIPAIGSDGTVYVGAYNGKLYAFGAGGSLLWSTAVGTSLLTGSAAVGANGVVYVVGPNGAGGSQVAGLSAGASGGAILWTTVVASETIQASCAIGSDGTVYGIGGGGGIYAFGANGGILWKYQAGDVFNGSPGIASDGTVYAMGSNGNMYAVTGGASGGTLLWSIATGDTFSQTSFALGTDGSVYFGGSSGKVYAVGSLEEVASLTLSPSSIVSAGSSTGTVTISLPAPSGGWVVNLSATNTHVSVPSSVKVPAGSTTATFPITTTQPTASFSSLITATDSVTTVSATLQVLAEYVTGLSLSPTTIGGGDTSTGTVTILHPAPAGGFAVNLASEYPSSVSVPATVTVPAGTTTGSFTITAKQFSNTFSCDIYASNGSAGRQATLNVVGDAISSFTLNPTSIGCNQTSTGTITLTAPAPSAGWTVNISDEYPSSVTVPASVHFAAGATTATFPVSSKQFSNTFNCDIYVSDGHSAKQATLQVVGDSIASLSLSPNSVVGGTSSTGTITLTSQAPPGGWTVNVSTEYLSVDQVPATVTVPAGALTATFTITTKATAASYGCGVYVSDGTSGKQATLTITPS